MPGWSNHHRPQFGQHTPVTRTHQCPPHPVGAGGVIACDDGGGVIRAPPCHCEGVRSTLKTLSYDCGNPVQYVCGQTPAVLFYLLDRHAPLAMTKGTKCQIPQSLTTPALRATPPMEGNLVRFHRGPSPPLRRMGCCPSTIAGQVPHLAEGWHASACRGGLIPTAHSLGNTPP